MRRERMFNLTQGSDSIVRLIATTPINRPQQSTGCNIELLLGCHHAASSTAGFTDQYVRSGRMLMMRRKK